MDVPDQKLLEEVRLYEKTEDRERIQNLCELYAIIIAIDQLEKVFSRDYISFKDYVSECSKLLTQYKTTIRLIPGLSIDTFLSKYKINCPAAKLRIAEDRPMRVEENKGAATVAEIVSLFITLLDNLSLSIHKVGDLRTDLVLLHDNVKFYKLAPRNVEEKVVYWHDKINGMSTLVEIEPEEAEQFKHDLSVALDSFKRSLQNA